MKRRKFITLLGGAAAAWPFAARAQQAERVRRIGVLMSTTADDPVGQARRAAFLQGLQQSGWTEDRNVRIDYRWAAAGPDRFRTYAAELVALAPDVILATGAQAWRPCYRPPAPSQSCSRSSPIPSVPAMSTVWRGQEAMPPALPPSNTAWVENGWSCSSRSRRA
jgi:hypothetical protein